MLIVLIACIGAAPVHLSWLWSRIIPWLHWPFRFNFVIKIESPQSLSEMAVGPQRWSACYAAAVGPWGPPLWGSPYARRGLAAGLAAARGCCPGSLGEPQGRGQAQGAASSSPPAPSTASAAHQPPAAHIAKALPERHIPYEILFYSSFVREKEGLGSKRLAFIDAPVRLVLSL